MLKICQTLQTLYNILPIPRSVTASTSKGVLELIRPSVLRFIANYNVSAYLEDLNVSFYGFSHFVFPSV